MKKLAKIIGALLALVIILALVAPMFISSDTLKAQLVAQVKKATGRTLEIKGETSVTFLPNIAVTAEDVTLSNPEGFTTPYLISLKKLATGAELRPLLNGELIINGITLDGATINLEELKSGARNWEFTAEKVKDSAEKSADAPEAQKNSSSAIKRFALGDIAISDGAITIIKPGAKVMAISKIDVTLKGADANSPLELDGSAEYGGETISIALDLAKTRDFLDDKFSPLAASLTLPGATLEFKGEGRMGDAIAARGKVNANAASLPKVLAWATGKQASPTLPEQVSLSGNAEYSGTTLKLTEATVRADAMKGEGRLAINHGGAVPKVEGNLAFGEIDLDAFTKTGGSTSGGGGGSGSGGSSGNWSSVPVDLSGLKALDADLDLAWEKLSSGKFTLGPTKAHAALNGGKLALTVKQTQLYSGTASGVLRASPGGIGADVKASGVDIEALMEALSGKSRLEGKTNLTLNVNASGNSQQAWVSSMNGNGTLRVTDGAFKGINIGRFLRDVKSSGLLFRSETESTDFSELSASFTIASGVLSNSDLAMKSPALRVAGSGSANLPGKTLNYRLVPTLAATTMGQGGSEASGLTIPLVITGSWSNPSVTPDLAGMVQEGLKDPAMLKENIKGIKDTIGDFNSTKDLKRALLGEKPAATTTTPAPATTETAPAAAPKSDKDLIKEGIGGLLQGFGK